MIRRNLNLNECTTLVPEKVQGFIARRVAEVALEKEQQSIKTKVMCSINSQRHRERKMLGAKECA